VLVSPQWIDRIGWDDRKVFVNLRSDKIKGAPEYDEDMILNRDYEAGLHGYYNRDAYWAERPSFKKEEQYHNYDKPSL
jgi:hypothetical protein